MEVGEQREQLSEVEASHVFFKGQPCASYQVEQRFLLDALCEQVGTSFEFGTFAERCVLDEAVDLEQVGVVEGDQLLELLAEVGDQFGFDEWCVAQFQIFHRVDEVLLVVGFLRIFDLEALRIEESVGLQGVLPVQHLLLFIIIQPSPLNPSRRPSAPHCPEFNGSRDTRSHVFLAPSKRVCPLATPVSA